MPVDVNSAFGLIGPIAYKLQEIPLVKLCFAPS